jgi:hypothetical protein
MLGSWNHDEGRSYFFFWAYASIRRHRFLMVKHLLAYQLTFFQARMCVLGLDWMDPVCFCWPDTLAALLHP